MIGGMGMGPMSPLVIAGFTPAGIEGMMGPGPMLTRYVDDYSRGVAEIGRWEPMTDICKIQRETFMPEPKPFFHEVKPFRLDRIEDDILHLTKCKLNTLDEMPRINFKPIEYNFEPCEPAPIFPLQLGYMDNMDPKPIKKSSFPWDL